MFNRTAPLGYAISTLPIFALVLLSCFAQNPHTRTSGPLRQLRFSADGQYILAQDDAAITVVTARPLAALFRIPAERADDAQFTPDSKQVIFVRPVIRIDMQKLALAGESQHVERWDLATQTRASVTALPQMRCGTERLSADGKLWACDDLYGVLRVFDVLSGKTVFEKQHFNKPVSGPGPPEHVSQTRIYSVPGNSRLEFSEGGRFLMAVPLDLGTPLLWDSTARKPVELAGALKRGLEAYRESFALLAGDRILTGTLQGRAGRWTSSYLLTEFPSGQSISELTLPLGEVAAATDPGIVLVHSDGGVLAFDLETAQVFGEGSSALDVFGDHFVAQDHSRALRLHVRPKLPAAARDRPFGSR
jgi:hypothetical protein